MKNIVTLDDKGVCKEWSNFMGKWAGTPTTCVWDKDSGGKGDQNSAHCANALHGHSSKLFGAS